MFGKVLVGVDGRAGGRDAIALARVLSGRRRRLVLGHVYREEAEAASALLTGERVATASVAETVTYRHANPAKGLRQLAIDEAADLLVLGSSHRSGLGRVLLGDHTLTALNEAPCAVAIAPRGYGSQPRTMAVIGIGYDRSAESEVALAAARRLAAEHKATIRLRSVISPERFPLNALEAADWDTEVDKFADAEERHVHGLAGVCGDVVRGDPGEELLALAPRLDLLIVGSRGQGPVGRLMNGSTSTYLAQHVPCPLLVFPRRLTASTARAPDEPSPDPPVPVSPAP